MDTVSFIILFSTSGIVYILSFSYSDGCVITSHWCSNLHFPLESPLNYKEIQPVHPKGDQSWVFIGRTDAEAETSILWPPHAKSWLIGKDSDAGRDWRQEEKGTIEDEMAGWHHRLDGHEFEWTPGVGDGQGGLACCDSWGCRVRHDWATELNWIDNQVHYIKTYITVLWKSINCHIFYYFNSINITDTLVFLLYIIL